MDELLFNSYEDLDINGVYNLIISNISPVGKILAVGDSAFEHAILNLPYFRNNLDKIDSIGINIDKSHCKKYKHFEIQYCDAHKMPFPDESFDCVISIMMLEHDPQFWLSLSEMNRVLKKNSPLIIAVPGFVDHSSCNIKSDNFHKGNGTVCYEIHANPDCYRFSPHFFEDVVFKNYTNVSLTATKLPPRLIGTGYK